MSRPPKPTAQKTFEGNPGKRSPGIVIDPPKTKRFPNPPAGIGKWGRAFWRERGEPLYDLGLLTVADVPAWTLICETYQRLKEADTKRAGEFVEYTKSGSKKHPLMAIVHQEQDRLAALLKEFGMTPVARERVNSVGGDDEDELEKLLNGSN